LPLVGHVLVSPFLRLNPEFHRGRRAALKVKTMKLKISINLDGAAFGDQPEIETARILSALAGDIAARQSLSDIGDREALVDINGNLVGEAKVTR
jgi:hypothetical protein